MQVTVKAKNIELTPEMRGLVEQKLKKLERYLNNVSAAEVEVSAEHARSATNRRVVQVTLRANGRILRAEERADEVRVAIDAVVDKLQNRLTRFKDRLCRRSKGAGEARRRLEEKLLATPSEAAQVVRVKRFSVKPMSLEEARLQMELLDHDFFVFLDDPSGDISILYRRSDGDLGLIQPEVP